MINSSVSPIKALLHCLHLINIRSVHARARIRYAEAPFATNWGPAACAPAGPSAWHFVGDEALDDPIAVPDAVVCAVPGSPQTELAPGSRQRGVDLPRGYSRPRSIAARHGNQSHSAFNFAGDALHSGGPCRLASAAARRSKPRMIQICSAFPLACAPTASSPAVTPAGDAGVVSVKRAYPIADRRREVSRDILDGPVSRQHRSVEPRRQHRLQAQRRGGRRPQRHLGGLGRRRQWRRLRRPDHRRPLAPTRTAPIPARAMWCSARPRALPPTSTCRALDGSNGFKLSGVGGQRPAAASRWPRPATSTATASPT